MDLANKMSDECVYNMHFVHDILRFNRLNAYGMSLWNANPFSTHHRIITATYIFTFPLRDHNNKWNNPSKELRICTKRRQVDDRYAQLSLYHVHATRLKALNNAYTRKLHCTHQTNLFAECKYLKIEIIISLWLMDAFTL